MDGEISQEYKIDLRSEFPRYEFCIKNAHFEIEPQKVMDGRELPDGMTALKIKIGDAEIPGYGLDREHDSDPVIDSALPKGVIFDNSDILVCWDESWKRTDLPELMHCRIFIVQPEEKPKTGFSVFVEKYCLAQLVCCERNEDGN